MPVEHAVSICRLSSGELIRGSEAEGSFYDVTLQVGCPPGSAVFALHHTHPGGRPVPSSKDIMECKRLGITRLCVEVPETGEMRCYDIGT